MGWKPRRRHFRSLAETTSKLLDPLLRKRAGLNIELMENWPQLVGEDIAQTTLPLKIIWSRRATNDEKFKPATLVVACEGYAAMRLTHESGEILQRINAFFGYIAIDRLKIEQRQVRLEDKKPEKKQMLTDSDRQAVHHLTDAIEDKALRHSLSELGFAIFSDKNQFSNKKFNK